MFTNMTANLMVEDVAASIAFYRDVLGFSVTASVPDGAGGLQFAIVQKDAQSLMFQERSNLIAEYPVLDTPNVRPSMTIYSMVDNFDELYAELKEKTGILCDVHTTFYGAREFAIADNCGYVLTFTEHKDA